MLLQNIMDKVGFEVGVLPPIKRAMDAEEKVPGLLYISVMSVGPKKSTTAFIFTGLVYLYACNKERCPPALAPISTILSLMR